MRYRAFAVAGTLLLSAPALGAAGDVLTVIGDNVNVRSGPGTEHAVQRQVSKLSGWSRSSGKATGCMPRSPIRAVRRAGSMLRWSHRAASLRLRRRQPVPRRIRVRLSGRRSSGTWPTRRQ